MSVLFDLAALVVPFEKLRMTDVESVGGKNASLGEMISQLPSGVRVPTGFATTAHAFREFLKFGGLTERINARAPNAMSSVTYSHAMTIKYILLWPCNLGDIKLTDTERSPYQKNNLAGDKA